MYPKSSLNSLRDKPFDVQAETENRFGAYPTERRKQPIHVRRFLRPLENRPMEPGRTYENGFQNLWMNEIRLTLVDRWFVELFIGLLLSTVWKKRMGVLPAMGMMFLKTDCRWTKSCTGCPSKEGILKKKKHTEFVGGPSVQIGLRPSQLFPIDLQKQLKQP